jgi:hypothetical protein
VKNRISSEIDRLDCNINDQPGQADEFVEEQKALEALQEELDEQLEAVESRVNDEEWMVIDGSVVDVSRVHDGNECCLPMVHEGRCSWYVAESEEDAGERARSYWADMAENDPKEFVCLVGSDTLVQWALGQWAGPGSTSVRSLDEWLDLHKDNPEEHWGEACTVDFCSVTLAETLGFTPTVAYSQR